MPDYCKVEGDPITAYRNYYINEKKRFATWKNKEIPEWFMTQNQKDIMTGCYGNYDKTQPLKKDGKKTSNIVSLAEKRKELKRMKTQEDILKMDMAELTKSYYDLLKRNKELVEENEKLKSQVGDWKNSLWGSHYRQRFHT